MQCGQSGRVPVLASSGYKVAALREAQHHTQTLELLDDGNQIVTFHAAGWLWTAWQLYHSGNKDEGVDPEGLPTLVEGYQ